MRIRSIRRKLSHLFIALALVSAPFILGPAEAAHGANTLCIKASAQATALLGQANQFGTTIASGHFVPQVEWIYNQSGGADTFQQGSTEEYTSGSTTYAYALFYENHCNCTGNVWIIYTC
jgi:hypothetical protein